jgi:hypothetical protein
LGFLIAIAPPVAGDAPTPEKTVEVQSEHFRLEAPADTRRLAEQVLSIAEAARKTVLDQMPQAFGERVGLAWCSTERDFYARLSRRGGHLLAAAVPSMRRVYLNGEQLQRLDRGDLHRALAHEFVHIYLGRVVPEPIPLWLNEGLAMYVAHEWGMADATALAADSLFGRLIPAEQLAQHFPSDSVGQNKAYRESYSMTAFLLDLRYRTTGVKGLVADLSDERDTSDEGDTSGTRGTSGVRALLCDPRWLDEFQREWLQRAIRPGRVTLVLTSGATFWTLAALLVLIAYKRKRRGRRRHEARWAFEEEFGLHDGYHDDEFDD